MQQGRRSFFSNKNFYAAANTNNLFYSTHFNNENSIVKSKTLNEDEARLLLEKAKAKNMLEAHNLIEYEIKQQILRKEQQDAIYSVKEDDKNKKDAVRNKKLRDLEEKRNDLLKQREDILNLNDDNINDINNGNIIINNNATNDDSLIANGDDKIIEQNNDDQKKKNDDILDEELDKKNIVFDNNDQLENNPKIKIQDSYLCGLNKSEALEYIDETLSAINEEIKRIKQDMHNDKLKKNYFKKREEEIKRKQEAFKLNCEKSYQEERKKADDRKKLLEEKQKLRLELMDEKRLQKMKKNENLKNLHQERLEKALNSMAEKNKIFTERIDKNQRRGEKRAQLSELRSIALKNRILTHMKRQKEIQDFMDKTNVNDELKLFQFQKKMDEIEKFKKKMDQSREIEIKSRNEELKTKSMKNSQNRNLKEMITDKQRLMMINRMKNFFFKSQQKKELTERELMMKYEVNAQNRTEKETNLRHIQKMKENERMDAYRRIQDIYKKYEEFQDQRLFISNKKKILAIEVANQRKLTLEKFEDFMNKNKDITVIILY